MGMTPAGCARVRSWGMWATENEAQGGAAKTAWKCRARTHPSTRSDTAGIVKSWSLPPRARSMASTSAPRACSSDAKVDEAAPSPAKTISTRHAGWLDGPVRACA
eukprot:3334068-Pleurochrysis_carterae.AAC.1